MDENVLSAGREIGVTDEDVSTLRKRRLIRTAVMGAVPLIGFVAGYLLRYTIHQEGISDLPLDEPTTYPYIGAVGLIRLPSRSRASEQTPKRFSGAGILTFGVVAFIIGFFMTDIWPWESSSDLGTTRYGVFSR